MADIMTMLSNLINPEVMGDMLRQKLADRLAFSPLATVDNTLVGIPGDTITLPKYAYIGDADDVAEGANIPITNLAATSTKVTIKKAGKGVDLTDESILSGYGDPVGEITNQLAESIFQKVDNDTHDALKGIKANMTVDVSATSALSSTAIVDGLVKFGEDLEGRKILLVAPEQLAQLRKDPDYINGSDLATGILLQGSVGMIWGCEVQLSNKVKVAASKFNNFIVKEEALAIYMKRNAEVESDRNITNKTTRFTADQHYATYLKDESKAIKLITAAQAPTPPTGG